MITLFTSIYLECNENRLAKLLLEVIGEIGSCTCIDNDQLLSDILKRYSTFVSCLFVARHFNQVCLTTCLSRQIQHDISLM